MTDNPIDAALADPEAITLDECLRRAPKGLTDKDITQMVTILRAERVSFQVKAERAAARKEGIEDEETTETTGAE